MSKKDEEMQFNVMPGADSPDEETTEMLDLSFDTVEEETPEVAAEETEEEVITEESEEVVAEEAPVDIEAEAEPSEPEAVVEEQPVAEEKPAKKPMVPKARLDEVLQKQKALQKQLDDMKAAQVPAEDAPEEYDFSAKEVEYQNHLLDGNADKAAAVRAEIRKAERTQIEYEMTQKMSDTVSSNHQASALQQAADTLEAEFPIFDSKSSEYDEALTQEVIDLRDAFIIKGDNAVAALSRAAKFVISENGLVDDSPSLGSTKSATDEVAKKRAEVTRKLKAADAQPPAMAGEGASVRGEKELDVANLSEDEFAALPEATLKRLRGDII
jgi:hypothetical protein